MKDRRWFLKRAGLGLAVLLGADLIDGITTAQKSTQDRQRRVEYILKNQTNPFNMVLQKLRGHAQVVGIGELHKNPNAELFTGQVVRQAANLGLINFVALELDVSLQRDVDNFINTGGINENMQNKILNWHGPNYFEIFRAARTHGLDVVCVDSFPAGDKIRNRDNRMSLRISNQKSRGIFYAGQKHVVKSGNELSSIFEDLYYSAITLQVDKNPHDPRLYTLSNAVKDANIHSPIGLDNISSSPFKDDVYRIDSVQGVYGNIADGLIVFPS
jgi:hypothetical protein